MASKARSREWRTAQAAEVIRRLEVEYPSAATALRFGSEWELTVAVILSAQATDKKVNEVTERLFRKYRSIEAYAAADPTEFEQDIRETGFFRNKTKHILGAAQQVLAIYGGEVPHSMAELVTLPGVARKTANIVLANADPQAFARDPQAGIAVDTHVFRLSHLLGLSAAKDPERTETDLVQIVPRAGWNHITYLLIEHGRAVCIARRPKCGACVLNDICPSAFNV
ncbi:MAG: endonuclease III [Actinobacteria bacterium]|nr:endonuclease III [Actinomycetota bacterium]